MTAMYRRDFDRHRRDMDRKRVSLRTNGRRTKILAESPALLGLAREIVTGMKNGGARAAGHKPWGATVHDLGRGFERSVRGGSGDTTGFVATRGRPSIPNGLA